MRLPALTDDLHQTPRHQRRQALLITALAMVGVYLLWNIRDLNFILYPLKLFVTYVHEAGHSLMALATGGEVIRFVVSPDGSGLAVTAGGSRALILPAGYLGAALFGSLLFFAVNRFPQYIHNIAIFLGGGMVVFTLLYARPDESGNLTAIVLGVGFGALLMFIGAKVHRLITMLLLNILAVSCALEAVLDLWSLMNNIGATRGSVHNDAAAFARDVTPLIPASLIALTWALVAVLMLATAVYYGVWQPLRREVDATYDSVLGR
ncbi:MAG: M50 family metallopeptidase [Anaerolineae bacterium]|jgi:hypothetical protein|nr:M50 family metallopeptidase [Anaerolineae bacterium]